MLLLAGAEVLGGDIHDAVGVDVEGDFNLRHTAAGRSNAVQMEAAEALVVSRHLTLTLQDVDFDGSLVVRGGGEDLALAGRDGGVAVDQLGAYTAQGLNAEGQRGDIDENDAVHILVQDAALDGSADGDAFIGVDALETFLASQGLDHLLHGRNTAGSADQQDLADVTGLQAGVGERLLDRAGGLLDQVMGQFVELCTGQGDIEVLRAGCIRRDVRQVDVGGRDAGELDLCLLGGFTQALHGDLVVGEVDALGLLELVYQILGDAGVKVIAAQTVVAGRGQNFDDAVADFKDRDIEGAAAQVIDHDALLLLLVDAISQSCCRRLVDNTLDIEAGDLAGVLGRLTLCIGEVSRNRDDRFGHRLSEISLCVRFQLLQHHGGDFLRCISLVVDGYFVVGAHLTLDGRDGAVRVGDGLALCDLADHTLAVLGKRHDRRSGTGAFRIRDDDRFAALEHSHAAVGCSEIDTDNFTHCKFLLYVRYVLTKVR